MVTTGIPRVGQLNPTLAGAVAPRGDRPKHVGGIVRLESIQKTGGGASYKPIGQLNE